MTTHDGWLINVPPGMDPAEAAAMFKESLVRTMGEAMGVVADKPLVADVSSVVDRISADLNRLRLERLQRWNANARETWSKVDIEWIPLIPVREPEPPLRTRVTPAQARQIREDVAEEFRGWAGL